MGRAWGNALGGWRRQRRAKNGQFGNGKTGKVTKVAPKSKSKAKATPKKTTTKKRSSAKLNKGNAVTALAGAAVAGAAVAAYRNRGITLYHNTTHEGAARIMKYGFDGDAGPAGGSYRDLFKEGDLPVFFTNRKRGIGYQEYAKSFHNSADKPGVTLKIKYRGDQRKIGIDAWVDKRRTKTGKLIWGLDNVKGSPTEGQFFTGTKSGERYYAIPEANLRGRNISVSRVGRGGHTLTARSPKGGRGTGSGVDFLTGIKIRRGVRQGKYRNGRELKEGYA